MPHVQCREMYRRLTRVMWGSVHVSRPQCTRSNRPLVRDKRGVECTRVLDDVPPYVRVLIAQGTHGGIVGVDPVAECHHVALGIRAAGDVDEALEDRRGWWIRRIGEPKPLEKCVGASVRLGIRDDDPRRAKP